MELVLASLASKTGKAVVCSMDNTVTDGTFFVAFKFLVKITFPDAHSFCCGSVLTGKKVSYFSHMQIMLI